MNKLEFLLDGVKYFAEDTRRICSNLETGKCKYDPINADNPLSEGCFIGRHLSPEAKKAWDAVGSSYRVIYGEHPDLIKMAPQWLQDLPVRFLDDAQALHDIKDNWEDEAGLTGEGVEYLEELLSRFEIEREPFKPYLS